MVLYSIFRHGEVTPVIKPTKLLMVQRIKSLFREPHWVKDIIIQLKLEAHVSYSLKVSIQSRWVYCHLREIARVLCLTLKIANVNISKQCRNYLPREGSTSD